MTTARVHCVLLACACGGLHAAGLALPEQSAASLGWSGGGVARTGRASNIHDNPAGIARLQHGELVGGALLLVPRISYDGPDGTADAREHEFVVPHAYLALPLDERWVAGLGVFAPFGLGTDWKRGWQGRYVSTYAELEVPTINPSIALRLDGGWSLGAGLRYTYASASIRRRIDAGLALYAASGADPALAPLIADADYDSGFALEGTGQAWNVDAGALWQGDRLAIGLAVVGPQ
ncbi:MAG: OmpP1/FadL family transporter, partial [Planctomycetota bacterium]